MTAAETPRSVFQDAPQVTIVSFGYLHGPAPEAHVTFDVREHYRDPHAVSPELRHLDAASPLVVRAVLATPGVQPLIKAVADVAESYRAGPSPARVTIAVGCAGGRHRSAVIADQARTALALRGVRARVVHRDIARPVVDRPAESTAAAETTETSEADQDVSRRVQCPLPKLAEAGTRNNPEQEL